MNFNHARDSLPGTHTLVDKSWHRSDIMCKQNAPFICQPYEQFIIRRSLHFSILDTHNV